MIAALARSYYVRTLAAVVPTPHEKALAGAAARVPAGIPVCADDPFVAHLAHRDNIFLYEYCAFGDVPVKPEALLLNRRLYAPTDLPLILELAEKWGLALAECNADYAYFAEGARRHSDRELFRCWFGTIEGWQCRYGPGKRFVADRLAHDGRAILVRQKLSYQPPRDNIYPPGRYCLTFLLRPADRGAYCRAVLSAHFADAEDASKFRFRRKGVVVVDAEDYRPYRLQLKSERPFRLKFAVTATAPFYFDAVSVNSDDFTLEAVRELARARAP